MVHYKKILLSFVYCSAFMLGVSAQAEPGSLELNRKALAGRLAYQDIEILVRYYKDSPAIVEAFNALQPHYTGTAVAGRLLSLLRTAQAAIVEQNDEDKAAGRFTDFLEFLGQGTGESTYLDMLKLLENSQFHQSLVDYPFLVRLFFRVMRASGLGMQSHLAQLREESQRFMQSSFFVDNRHAALGVVHTAFEEVQHDSPHTRIQHAIDALESYFAENALSLFNGLHTLMSMIMERSLPEAHQNDSTARRAREHLFTHAVQFQEVLQDPDMLRLRNPLQQAEGGSAPYCAGLGLRGSGMPPARL